MSTDAPALSEKILKDLAELWTGLGKQEPANAHTGVLRACAMTMIVVCDDCEDTAQVNETLALLMREHPSRAILLRVQLGREGPIEARVFAQCWMPFGRRQQICCEEVEVTVPEAVLSEAPAVLRSVLAPDLPVVIWCRASVLAELAEFRGLLPLGDKVILDSIGAADSRAVLVQLQDLGSEGIRVADLNWSRLTRWRKAIARIFDDPARRARLAEITRLSIVHRNPDPPPTVYYVAAWIEHVLGRRIETAFSEEPGASEGFVQRVTLSGPDLEYSVTRAGGDQVELKIDALTVPARFPFLADHELLHEELSIQVRDAIYDEVLRLAIQLAGGDRKGS